MSRMRDAKKQRTTGVVEMRSISAMIPKMEGIVTIHTNHIPRMSKTVHKLDVNCFAMVRINSFVKHYD